MHASRRRFASFPAPFVVLALVSGCVGSLTFPNSPSCSTEGAATPTGCRRPTVSGEGDLVIVGRIVTMDEPAVAAALLIEEGLVTCIGTRDEVLARAGEEVQVVDIGSNVAYPGFIDAHAHWIGDRQYYGIASPAEAMEEAVSRGWTSISEQWVDRERLDELESLAADGALPMRIDAYLALNGLDVGAYYGDWYADRQPGAVADRLRVQGLKIHLDSGSGAVMYWDAATLTETIGRANDAGWQVSVHAVSTEAQETAAEGLRAVTIVLPGRSAMRRTAATWPSGPTATSRS